MSDLCPPTNELWTEHKEEEKEEKEEEATKTQGRPRIQWIDNIKKLTTLNYREAIRTAQDREKWPSVSSNPRPVDGT